MIDSVKPGITSEGQFRTLWDRRTQRVREGGEIQLIYRIISNPAG